MQTDPPKADPPKRKCRWYQFSLRTLMIVVSLFNRFGDWNRCRASRFEVACAVICQPNLSGFRRRFCRSAVHHEQRQKQTAYCQQSDRGWLGDREILARKHIEAICPRQSRATARRRAGSRKIFRWNDPHDVGLRANGLNLKRGTEWVVYGRCACRAIAGDQTRE